MIQPIKVFKEKKGKKILRIFVDEDGSESPREWDNIGKMVCFHRRYNLGDKTDLKPENFNGWDELKQFLIKERNAVKICSLYLYDHSGLRIKIGSFQGLLPQGHAEFDTSQIGFIYIDKETMVQEKLNDKKMNEVLMNEVKTYDEYLNGDVYGFELVEPKKCKTCGNVEEKMINSVWGFYGSDFEENGLFESTGIDKNKFVEVEQ